MVSGRLVVAVVVVPAVVVVAAIPMAEIVALWLVEAVLRLVMRAWGCIDGALELMLCEVLVLDNLCLSYLTMGTRFPVSWNRHSHVETVPPL